MRWFRTGAALMLAAAMMAGCGTGSQSTAPPDSGSTYATPSTQTAPAAKESVRLAPGPWGAPGWMQTMVAEGLGTFANNHIDLQVLKTTGGSDATRALMNGEADVALLAFSHAIRNRAQGADLVVIGFISHVPGVTLIVQNEWKDQVKTAADLKGMRIGVSSIGGGTHAMLVDMLRKYGLSDTDVNVIATKDELVTMWREKKIAAAVHIDPQITELVEGGEAWILIDLRTEKDTKELYGSEYPLGTMVTREQVLKARPEAVQRFLKSVIEANEFITHSTPEAIANAIPEVYRQGFDPQLYVAMVRSIKDGIALEGTVSRAGMETAVKGLKATGIIPADQPFDLDALVNLTLIEQARTQVARK